MVGLSIQNFHPSIFRKAQALKFADHRMAMMARGLLSANWVLPVAVSNTSTVGTIRFLVSGAITPLMDTHGMRLVRSWLIAIIPWVSKEVGWPGRSVCLSLATTFPS